VPVPFSAGCDTVVLATEPATHAICVAILVAALTPRSGFLRIPKRSIAAACCELAMLSMALANGAPRVVAVAIWRVRQRAGSQYLRPILGAVSKAASQRLPRTRIPIS